VVVVADVPGADRGRALVFAGELSGVEEFFAEDALLALDALPVVPGRAGLGFLVQGLVADDA
jgi:hypothetical protein